MIIYYKYYVILYKGHERPRILVAMGHYGTNPWWILRDNYRQTYMCAYVLGTKN